MQTILIVEDDKTIAESICFILEKDSFNCKWYDNGKDALEFHKDNVLGLEGLGANAYVTKPLSPRLVVAHVRAQLRMVKPEVKSGDSKFSINHAMQRVVFLNQDLILTPAEYKILSHLVKNPNRVHSREYLMSIIWDRPHGSDIKTINTHIKSIRKRLHELDENNEYIETHRGIGYSLIE